jgi:hypothetical protein
VRAARRTGARRVGHDERRLDGSVGPAGRIDGARAAIDARVPSGGCVNQAVARQSRGGCGGPVATRQVRRAAPSCTVERRRERAARPPLDLDDHDGSRCVHGAPLRRAVQRRRISER